jgi:hypothetical protein
MQLDYNGETYTHYSVKETISEWNIVCSDSPNKVQGEMKDLATLDWIGEDGQDVYVPSTPRMKPYDMQFKFIYEGQDDNFVTDTRAFLSYLKAKRLAFYESFTKIGRKDVLLTTFDPDVLVRKSVDNTSIMTFSLNFRVYDPVTDVVSTYSDANGIITGLGWSS